MLFIPRYLSSTLILTFFVIFSAGCATKSYSVSTNKAPAPINKIQKVLVIISVDSNLSLTEASKFQEYFLSSLRQKMQSYCVQSNMVEVNKLELVEGQAARQAISDFHPQELLEVSFIPGVSITGQNFEIHHGKLRFALSEAIRQGVVWRGEVSSRFPNEPEDINASVTEFVEKMQQDGVLGNQCEHVL